MVSIGIKIPYNKINSFNSNKAKFYRKIFIFVGSLIRFPEINKSLIHIYRNKLHPHPVAYIQAFKAFKQLAFHWNR